jgi:DNA-binding CsgD family transcriptional regulator
MIFDIVAKPPGKKIPIAVVWTGRCYEPVDLERPSALVIEQHRRFCRHDARVLFDDERIRIASALIELPRMASDCKCRHGKTSACPHSNRCETLAWICCLPPSADGRGGRLRRRLGRDAEIGIRGVSGELSSSAPERWLAHVLPLASGARREAGMTFSASAAVFVRKTCLDAPSALETLAKLYRLTGTEVRALQGIVDIGGIPKVAKALGISEGTTKSHLKNLFAKTGTNRQVDLVKLVADAVSPFTRE